MKMNVCSNKLWFRGRDVLITVTLFAGALVLYSFSWFYTLSGRYDDLVAGVSTIGAERVLSGEIPYRDFWTMYAPGHFYLNALLFRIFGTHLLVEVVAASVVCAAAVCTCYWLVLNLVDRRPAALACAGIFLAAIYNTGYFKRLGSYPPAILFILVAFNFMVLYYKTGKLGRLVAAGLATGVVIVFKHDVGGYTAIAIVASLIIHHLLTPTKKANRMHLPLLKLFVYCAGVGVIVFPLLLYFIVLAGPDMLQNLIVFPLTDFRFARPEGYPSLFPTWIYNDSVIEMLKNFFHYLNFTIPFVLFLLGLVATALAVRRRRPEYVAAGVMFSVAYLFHYSAAHIQINTHIITMSVYAVCLGAIFYDLAGDKFFRRRPILNKLLVSGLIIGWLLSFAAHPVYTNWKLRKHATVKLELPKVSGFKVSPSQKHNLENFVTFVDTHIPPGQELFVGLHRHDVLVIGAIMIYFVLDRPNATRYQELHPAITDTAPVQQEIINDLQGKNIPFIILREPLFSDEVLERVKKDFLRNLPHIGAKDLDEFIRKNYMEVRKFGSYAVWKRKEIFEIE